MIMGQRGRTPPPSRRASALIRWMSEMIASSAPAMT
jgi:hypothetical protein